MAIARLAEPATNKPSLELKRALPQFARFSVELAQKAGGDKNPHEIMGLMFWEGPCSHSFPQKVCIVPRLPGAGSWQPGMASQAQAALRTSPAAYFLCRESFSF